MQRIPVITESAAEVPEDRTRVSTVEVRLGQFGICDQRGIAIGERPVYVPIHTASCGSIAVGQGVAWVRHQSSRVIFDGRIDLGESEPSFAAIVVGFGEIRFQLQRAGEVLNRAARITERGARIAAIVIKF